MADDRRKNEVTRATVHRVYRLAESLRQAVSARRRDLGLTLRAFVAEAVEGELPALVEVLRDLLPPAGEKTRPARLPLSDALLGLLRQASEDAGVSAAKLLACCLARAAARKRRRRAAPPESAATPRSRRSRPGASPSPQEAIEPAVRREDAIGPAEPAAESAGDPELP